MKKISYSSLQKKYAGKVVVLNKGESKVMAAGQDAYGLLRRLKNKGINLKECVFVGPVQKAGTVNVYFHFPLRKKDN